MSQTIETIIVGVNLMMLFGSHLALLWRLGKGAGIGERQ